MVDLIATNRKTAILGMGVTGLSVARFMSAKDLPFVFADSRKEPPRLKEVTDCYPDVTVALGDFDTDLLANMDRVVVSPGISLDEPALVAAREQGIELIGDLELFLEHADAPVIAITGSNGKSTVTTLLGEMARASGLSVGVGGNLGTPMLDLLDDKVQLYILELSSFQLELLNDSRGAVVALLNISADHMDRYAGLPEYHAAKHRIFRGASKVVINREDVLTKPLLSSQISLSSFGLNQPDLGDFGILEGLERGYLSYGIERLMPVADMSLKGSHNVANALAALALGYAIDLPMKTMLQCLKTFNGLPHRCETVAEFDGVLYIDDSKATNVGATIAALKGLGSSERKNLILIAGGQSKDQDFNDLQRIAGQFVKRAYVFGEDGAEIDSILGPVCDSVIVDSLPEAVGQAASQAAVGDTVLLSPACASFDMFSGFEERGRCFQQAVNALSKRDGDQLCS
ncbi:MAG: UDP-N-acetylmuramoyl-L-alanine--D-glutamate ligase [Porticoccaceae bacterium]